MLDRIVAMPYLACTEPELRLIAEKAAETQRDLRCMDGFMTDGRTEIKTSGACPAGAGKSRKPDLRER
jgi:hypothetical protein